VAEALAHAHAAAAIHRDIKPEKILLSGGHALVTDFGVAKALVEAVPNRAPEQAAGDPAVDHRTDVSALGVVGCELLAGARAAALRFGHQRGQRADQSAGGGAVRGGGRYVAGPVRRSTSAVHLV
jgi:serine/threonine-protein kinase